MADTRTYALAIYEILKDNSDENHILTNPEIIYLLNINYGIDIDRQTVLNNIKALIQFGIDISTYTENRKGYYLIDRDFEDSEIHLLCNCIHSAHYIPEKASADMIKKLCSKQSKYKRKSFVNQVYIKNYKKTKNKELLYNIDIINEAISKNRVIEFHYYTYDYTKKLVLKREKKYAVNPYYIIQGNDNLYLICKSINHDDISHYRIDKMQNITISENFSTQLKQSFDPYDYAKSKKFMFSGEVIKITLHCHKRMLDDLIDQFGDNITINPDVKDSEYFFVRLESSKQGIIYFALQYLNFCEIVEPKEIRNELLEILKKKIELYNR